MQIFNRRDELEVRRNLRRSAPATEQIVWAKIRAAAIEGAKFRRQASVGKYVLDFYCPELRLALEIDGPTHDGEIAVANDAARQEEIEALRIRFLRFANARIYGDLEAVLSEIGDLVLEMRAEKLLR